MKYINKVTLLIMMLLVACSAYAKVYTEKDKSITVSSTQPDFTVRLKSNPTTGYVWTLRSDDDSIRMNKHDYMQSAEKSGLVGAGGYDEWQFSAQPGFFIKGKKVALHFVYKRNWERAAPAKKIEFTVTAA